MPEWVLPLLVVHVACHSWLAFMFFVWFYYEAKKGCDD